eukprot:gene14796-10583_t
MLVAVGSSFAVECAGNRKIITAFHNISFPEPDDRVVNTTEPYYVVQTLHSRQTVDGRAVPMVYKGCGDHERDWAILEVAESSTHVFRDTFRLRSVERPLPSSLVATTRLKTIHYQVGLRQVHEAVFIEATATDFQRVEHVYSDSVEMTHGLCKGASGAPMIDPDECVACLHVDSIREVDFPNKRIKLSGIASQVSSSHAHSHRGSIIFNIPALIDNLRPAQRRCARKGNASPAWSTTVPIASTVGAPERYCGATLQGQQRREESAYNVSGQQHAVWVTFTALRLVTDREAFVDEGRAAGPSPLRPFQKEDGGLRCTIQGPTEEYLPVSE